MSYEVDVSHADKHERFLQVDIFIFDGFDQTCPDYLGKFGGKFTWVSCHMQLKKGDRNEVRGLTVLAGLLLKLTLRFYLAYTTFTIYYTSNV